MKVDPNRAGHDPLLEPIAQAAQGLLEAAGALPVGWSIRSVARLSEQSVQLDLGVDGLLGVYARIEWAEPSSPDYKAYRVGPRFAASYRNPVADPEAGAPGADTCRAVALQTCEVLAAPEEGVSLVDSTTQALAPSSGPGEVPDRPAEPPASLDEVIPRLRTTLPVGAELVEGWHVAAYQEPDGAEELHVALVHEHVPMRLRIVLVPRQEGRWGLPEAAGLHLLHSTRFGLTVPESVMHHYGTSISALQHVLRGLDSATPVPVDRSRRPPTRPPSEEAAEVVARTCATEPWALMYHDRLREAVLAIHPTASWELWGVAAALEEGAAFEFAGRPGVPLAPGVATELAHVLMQRVFMSAELAAMTVQVLCAAFECPLVTDQEGPWPPCEEPLPPSSPLSPPTLSGPALPRGDEVGGSTMIRVPAGVYTVGDPDLPIHPRSLLARRGIATPAPRRPVRLTRPFAIGAVPVTHALWQEVLGETTPDATLGRLEHPADGLDFRSAVVFCNAASRLAGLPEVYGIDGPRVRWIDPALPGYRLPTAAEWEVAARAGSAERFGLGEVLTSELANFDDQARPGGVYLGSTTPVGRYPANEWGLYDVHGNVWEWCWDWCAPLAAEAPLAVDPRGPEEGELRLVKGGAWTAWRDWQCSPALRVGFRPDMTGFDCGLRLARTVDEG